MTPTREPVVLLSVVVVAVAASAIAPKSFGTWLLEVAPIAVAVPVLVWTYAKFPLTPISYRILAVSALLIALGAHYAYAEVPLGHWMRDWFDFSRNHYDRIGHVAQGATAAIVLRELLLRLTPLRGGWWLFGIVTGLCLGVSGEFEVEFDAQWDTVCALVGALIAQFALNAAHDRQHALAGP